MKVQDEELQVTHVDNGDEEKDDSTSSDSPNTDINRPNGTLHRALKERHMQMIALGGSIGAGLFVGSGKALSSGGPASLLLGFIIIGIMILCTVQSLGELAVMYPVNGAFHSYSVQFVDPAWGFAMGWQYAVGWLLTLPFEITAAGITIKFWTTDINVGVWITIFLFAVTILQVFGVKGYGESEFILTLIKVFACIVLIIVGITINVGGVPTDDRGYIGGRYWHDPGAFRNGFRGFTSVFTTASFAYGGAEIVGLTAAEADNPAKSIPKATKQVFWRILIFYILNLLLVGLNVPSDSPTLLGAGGGHTKTSPFVIAIKMAGIKVLPSIINATITITLFSVANASIYASTRTLQALASSGRAPKIFAYIDPKGRPVWCIVLQAVVGLLAFINEIATGEDIFSWLLALSGLSGLFINGTICLSHIRFRKAWRVQGRDINDIPWRSPLGVAGSWVGLSIVFIATASTFYTALFPSNKEPGAHTFFSSFLAAPISLALFIGWKIYLRDFQLGVDLRAVDLDVGRRIQQADEPDDQIPNPRVSIWNMLLRIFF